MELLQQHGSNNEALQQYYSNILGQQLSTTNQKIDKGDHITFPEFNNMDMILDVAEDQKAIVGSEKLGTNVVQKLHKGIPTVENSSKIAFSNIYNNNKFKYIVTQGNNSKLIREAMKTRPWWVEIPNVDSAFNFKWQPVSYRMKFRDLVKKSPIKRIVNHFEFHR